MSTRLGSVQQFGSRERWPEDAIYIGNQWSVSRKMGISDIESLFGKPWDFHHKPDWARLYLTYLVTRMAREPEFEQAVKALHGHLLLCWCVSKETWRGAEVPCHGRILIEFVEMLNA